VSRRFPLSSGQGNVVEHGVGEHALEFGVLLLERAQPLRRLADAVPAAQLRCRSIRFLLAQNRNGLLFRKPRSRRVWSFRRAGL
jgi:hypothetical protein